MGLPIDFSRWFWKDFFLGFSPYGILMLMMAIVVALPALTVSLSFFVAVVLIFPLLEDMAFFVWARRLIKPSDWTARWGSIQIGKMVVPYWYFVVGGAIVVLLLVS